MYNEPDTTATLDTLLAQAFQLGASDIHIEPDQACYRVRFRTHGDLQLYKLVPMQLATRIITRIKLLAKLDIAEKRLPQDGRLNLTDANFSSVRVSSCLTCLGEKIVLRLFKKNIFSISELGMRDDQLRLFTHHLNRENGLIIVSGATGSGKTATLYSALGYLNSIQRNIVSIEDPVEQELIGINQVNINADIGLTFSTCLRSLLRQDPDIIMIGEIRDRDTALIALQAAQTGHLVLSTLHASNIALTQKRIEAMDIPSHYFTDSISLIVSQSLIKLDSGQLTGCFDLKSYAS